MDAGVDAGASGVPIPERVRSHPRRLRRLRRRRPDFETLAAAAAAEPFHRLSLLLLILRQRKTSSPRAHRDVGVRVRVCDVGVRGHADPLVRERTSSHAHADVASFVDAAVVRVRVPEVRFSRDALVHAAESAAVVRESPELGWFGLRDSVCADDEGCETQREEDVVADPVALASGEGLGSDEVAVVGELAEMREVVAVQASLGVVDVEAHALALARHLGELFLLELRERAALGESLVQGLVRRVPRLAGHGRAEAAVGARGSPKNRNSARRPISTRASGRRAWARPG